MNMILYLLQENKIRIHVEKNLSHNNVNFFLFVSLIFLSLHKHALYKLRKNSFMKDFALKLKWNDSKLGHCEWTKILGAKKDHWKKNIDINAVPKINHKPSQTQLTTNIYLFKVNNGNIRKRHDIDVFLVFLSLTLNIFHTFFWCFFCWLWTSKCSLESMIWIKIMNIFSSVTRILVKSKTSKKPYY